ncbi:MAG: type I restriction enzyme HsdR N-terminal domain-containing protein [Candidatus Eisenbacteria bacterium]|nr:type I restriction enzyme HsdR N-terminal domain-containing protein [Candidatus Eisenbacteria bacterium]
MARLPNKAIERIAAGLKRFQPILAAAKSRDVNESDTVVIVTDLLQDVFGYDKYAEITSEHMIRSTFCDLAVKLGGSLAFLIEVKAIGLDLKEQFVRQAVDYAANQGVEWVALTNGVIWKVYRVSFVKPIEHELVVDIDLLAANPRNTEHIRLVGLLAKEGWQKAQLGVYHSQKQALSRFTLGALIVSDPVLDLLRREIRRLSPNVRIEAEEIRRALEGDVLKRDVLEGDKADAARKHVAKSAGRTLRAARSSSPSKEFEPQETSDSEETAGREE